MKLSNNKLILLVLSFLCIVMIGVTTVRDEWLSPLRTAVGYFLMPVQSGVNRVGKSLYNTIKDHDELKSALEDKKKLQSQIDQLVLENTRLQEDSFELVRLRQLFELSQDYGQYRTVGARVIAKDSGGWFHIFRIDKGSADGIRVDMNVIAGGGLVGIVTDVGANYATVRSIIDDVSRVSAMEIQSGDTCIVSGDLKMFADGKLKISDITDTAEIYEGDKIVTSTVSSKYLPGILIGYVNELQTDPARLTRSGTLIPVADFGTLQEVLVIMDLKAEMNERSALMPPAAGPVETVAAPGETVPQQESAVTGETKPAEQEPQETEPEDEETSAEDEETSGETEPETESVVIVERGQ